MTPADFVQPSAYTPTFTPVLTATDGSLLLAIPAFAPAIVIAGVVIVVAVRGRRREAEAEAGLGSDADGPQTGR